MRRQGWSRILILTPLIWSLGLFEGRTLDAQEWHPMLKERWSDWATWPVVAPGDLDADPGKFVGLRVRYQSQRGPVDSLTTQDIVVEFQPAARNGAPVIVVSYVALGNIDAPDVSSEWWTAVVEPRSLTMLDFVLARPSGSGVMVQRPTESGTMSWRLRADEDHWSEPRLDDRDEPVFDLFLWGQILSAMDLEEGMKFRLAVGVGERPGALLLRHGRQERRDGRGAPTLAAEELRVVGRSVRRLDAKTPPVPQNRIRNVMDGIAGNCSSGSLPTDAAASQASGGKIGG